VEIVSSLNKKDTVISLEKRTMQTAKEDEPENNSVELPEEEKSED
jgi:hypothetical protein